MKSLLITTFALVCATIAVARPAYPGLLYATMEDGTRVAYHIVGDEYSHACLTLDGRYIQQVISTDEPIAEASASGVWRYVDQPQDISDTEVATVSQSTAPAASAPLHRAPQNVYTTFPTIGEMKGLVLLVNYTDKKFHPDHTVELLDRQLNEEGYSDNGATGSARDYFVAQSMGVFQPHFDVVGPVELPHSMAYYGSNQGGQDARPGQMIVDACQYAHDSLSIDFSQYDFDDNGEVDFVFVLYAGYGENYGASSNTIWPHMSYLHAQYLNCQLDGKDINLYACSCELRYTTGSNLDGIGALCHEFGHCLGLPDIYNTYNQGIVQLGSWGVMDSGSYNNNSRTPASYTSFERNMLGWLDFIELTEPQDSVVLPELTQNNIAYRITTPDNPNEFFTLENHQQLGWDSSEGGRGLMIIHVDYTDDAWQGNYVNSGTYPHYDLVEADGTAGRTLGTDLYPISGNNMFTDYSNPNSLSWAGTPTDKGVTKIQQHDDGSISFRFMNDRLRRPVLLPAAHVTDTSFCAQWEPVEGAMAYRLDLLEELPDSLNPLLLGEDFSLADDGEYPSATNHNIANSINDYTHTPGWSGQYIYPCGGMIRLGSYGSSGNISTPTLSCTDTTIVVSLRCCAYTGKSVNYDVILLDQQNNEVHKQTFKATREVQTPLIQFNDVPGSLRIKIASNKERLFIDELRIAHGQIDSLQLWTAGPRQWSIECSADATSADATTDYSEATLADGLVSCLVSPLIAGRTYHYYVTAIDAEPLRNSLPSSTEAVTLLLESSIDAVKSDKLISTVYDIQGRNLGHNISNLPSGFYIVDGQKMIVR